MPELRGWRFPKLELVHSDEVSLGFSLLVRGVDIAPLGVGEERVPPEGLLVVVQSSGMFLDSPIYAKLESCLSYQVR